MSAWEAEVLPLNYTRAVPSERSRADGVRPRSYPYRAAAPNRPGGRWRGARCDRATARAASAGYGGAVLLSDRDIRAELDQGRVVLDPYEPAMLQPSSIDVRLDRYFRLFDNHKYPYIDPSQEQPDLTRLVEVTGDEPFVLHPGEFVLGSTFESITLPDDVAARLEGKSSLGRLGLLTHSTAGFIDPGFSGHVTLELSNVATLPIMLWPGMKIGQTCFFRLSSPAEHPYGSSQYGSRYQGQRGPTASRSWQSFHRTAV
ncbi:dCTP deaminase [Xylanimonas allomyrinae]|uniref:dCTP deaminase, dUMP-forming n=1 Tax=Xylanimonas allomyrinae TaxID=2509459 RepID=A0A4P6F3D4_9MICO|nr:dCTP deaminase [Xylanimonas allomyrinae]